MAIGNGKIEVELGEAGNRKQREQRYCATARKHVMLMPSPTLVDGAEKKETAKERKQARCGNRVRTAGYLAAVLTAQRPQSGIHETGNAKSKAGSGCRLGHGGPRSHYASIERDWRGVPTPRRGREDGEKR